MSLIETSTRPAKLARGTIFALATAAPTLTSVSRASAKIGVRGRITGANLSAKASGTIGLSGRARARLNSEPTIFPVAVGAIEILARARATRRIKPFAGGRIVIEAQASPDISTAESATLDLIVDILPPTLSGNYQTYSVRLTVGETIVPIESYEIDALDTAAGVNFSASLARFSDRDLFIGNPAIKFEIDDGDGFYTEFEGTLLSTNLRLANDGDAPADTFSFAATDNSSNRLNGSPPGALVVYDSRRETVDIEDYEPVYDSVGRSYPLTAVPVPNLSLHGLFQKIFVDRCGFASFRTNLPDYPLRRADFGASATYLDGVAPHVGMFSPVIFEEANVLWIVDASFTLPSGFPAPRTLAASKIDGYQSAREVNLIDGYDVSFAETEAGEFFTTRLKQKTETVGNFSTDTATTIREYRLPSQPYIILSERVSNQTVSIHDGVNLISRTAEVYTYDNFGRFKNSVKTIEKLVPNLPDSTGDALRIVQTENLSVQYGVNPFEPTKQIQRRSELVVSGLIAVDQKNKSLGKDYPEAFVRALEGGNLRTDEMTFQIGLIETQIENFRPLRNGQTEVSGTRINHVPAAVGGAPIAVAASNEPRPGDASLARFSGKQNTIRIYRTDAANRTAAVIENFGIGELPLALGIPLARRNLLRQLDKNQKISSDIIGIDESVRRGSVLSVWNRETDLLASLIVEGYKKSGAADGATSMQLRGRQI